MALKMDKQQRKLMEKTHFVKVNKIDKLARLFTKRERERRYKLPILERVEKYNKGILYK